MNRKYKATGIVLKGTAIKENDRLVTVLSPECGLIRAVAPGAKKHKSRLRGRTELFVINELLLVEGRSLDKIIQANTLYTHPGLSRDLGKLAAAQYLGEVTLALAIAQQPQSELYQLLKTHLRHIEDFPVGVSAYPYLAQAILQLLTHAGLAPQLHSCCLTQQAIELNLASNTWRAGFSFAGGGVVNLKGLQTLAVESGQLDPEEHRNTRLPNIEYRLNAPELKILQRLACHELTPQDLAVAIAPNSDSAILWMRVEQVLREYMQYHVGKQIRSAKLVDNLYTEF